MCASASGENAPINRHTLRWSWRRDRVPSVSTLSFQTANRSPISDRACRGVCFHPTSAVHDVMNLVSRRHDIVRAVGVLSRSCAASLAIGSQSRSVDVARFPLARRRSAVFSLIGGSVACFSSCAGVSLTRSLIFLLSGLHLLGAVSFA